MHVVHPHDVRVPAFCGKVEGRRAAVHGIDLRAGGEQLVDRREIPAPRGAVQFGGGGLPGDQECERELGNPAHRTTILLTR